MYLRKGSPDLAEPWMAMSPTSKVHLLWTTHGFAGQALCEVACWPQRVPCVIRKRRVGILIGLNRCVTCSSWNETVVQHDPKTWWDDRAAPRFPRTSWRRVIQHLLSCRECRERKTTSKNVDIPCSLNCTCDWTHTEMILMKEMQSTYDG